MFQNTGNLVNHTISSDNFHFTVEGFRYQREENQEDLKGTQWETDDNVSVYILI